MNKSTINEKIAWLLDLNRHHSDEFMRTRPLRQLYRVRHPTEITTFECMDGRLHIPTMTRMPLGIIRPYRNVGGYFDLGWPLLGEQLKDWVEYGIRKGRKSMILVTYHYSRGDPHRGCAGFSYDCEAAIRFTIKLHAQVNKFFGHDNQVVFPIVVGIETDTDSLIFHPQDPTGDNIVTCCDTMSDTPEHLLEVIRTLYPDMDRCVCNDLLPLMQGNIAHIKDVKEKGRDLTDMKHKEWLLLVGGGADWLHVPNTALIVGPYDPDLSKPIIKAIGIIENNMKSGQINDDGFLILSSVPFKEDGIDKNRAREKANFFRTYVGEIMKEHYPELLSKAKFIAAVIDERTRRIEQIPEQY
jgi:hypothetical protein